MREQRAVSGRRQHASGTLSVCQSPPDCRRPETDRTLSGRRRVPVLMNLFASNRPSTNSISRDDGMVPVDRTAQREDALPRFGVGSEEDRVPLDLLGDIVTLNHLRRP